ncbi:MAG: DUF3168 domain-containing protein [Alphaproteobacteria bacterium]|nr:DUF3168 domain-containing protein [Alphaproteobacteria bacterium]MBV9371129.1 DUF3168 domain-containing protein [Alphaproteobacteria bacterium]MBV9900781.1 DUF3168 domain-containing protein [Alphaproteobacteria bacterium]
MSGAGAALQDSAIARLAGLDGLSAAYPGAPLQAVFPYATVECGVEADWGHKSGAGRELRLAVTLRDRGEAPLRIRALMEAAEARLASPPAAPGWQVVSFARLRSRLVREGRSGELGWTGMIEYRARLLQEGGDSPVTVT